MFDPAAKLPNSDFSLSKHMAKNYDSRVQKTAQSYRSWNTMGADGTSTPLWGTNPSPSPPRVKNINYRCLSPSSKAQAIARGQRELMEMVSRMPESCFELTLKDLVEYRDAAVELKQESCAEGRGAFNEDEYSKEKGTKKKKKKKKKPQIKRSGSIDSGGFLLKMAFPFSLGSKSKNNKEMKRNGSNVNHNCRVSPKPTVSDESSKGIDKEWWKKRSGSSESDSGGSNINSGSTKSSRSSSGSVGNTSRRHTGSGCLAFIFNRKSKASR